MPVDIMDLVGGGGLPAEGRYVVTSVHGEIGRLDDKATSARIVFGLDARDEETGESLGSTEAKLTLFVGGSTEMKNGDGFRLATEHGVPFDDCDISVNEDAGTHIVTRVNGKGLMNDSSLSVFIQNFGSACMNNPDVPRRVDEEGGIYEGGKATDISIAFLGADLNLIKYTIPGRKYTKNGQEAKTKDFTTLVPSVFHGYVDEEPEVEEKPSTKATAAKTKTKTPKFDPTPDTDLNPQDCVKEWIGRAKEAGLSPEEAAGYATQAKAMFKPNQSQYKVAFVKLTATYLKSVLK